MYMLVSDTILTHQAKCEAVQAAEQCLSDATILTGGGFVPQVQHFLFDKLVGKLVPVLEPVLEV